MRNSSQPAVRGDIAMARGPWMSQYNTIINMNSHYQRLNKVKSTIDTSAPKSLSTNTRKRDSVNRSIAMGLDPPKTYRQPNSSRLQSARPQTARPYSSRPSSSRSELRPNSSRGQKWNYGDPETVTMEPPLHEQLEALQLLKTEDFEGEPGKDYSLERAQREKDEMADRLIMMYGGGEAGRDVDKRTSQPLSRQTSRAKDASYPVKDASHPLKSQRSMTSQSRPRSRATRSGDVLESRSHVFTATEKDFSPRILNKPKATSRLSQSKHYFRPKPKPPIKPSMFAGTSLVSVGDQGTLETRSSTPLEDWRLSRDNDERFETNSSEGVPKLDISLDQDNLKYLKRQESMKSQRQRKISELSLASLSEEKDEETRKGSHEQRINGREEQENDNEQRNGLEERTNGLGEQENGKEQGNGKEQKIDKNDDMEKQGNDVSVMSENESPPKTEDKVKTNEHVTKNEYHDSRDDDGDKDDEDDDDDGSVAEKELLYLKFIQDVTSDLLSTGRISERILTEIFKRHVDEYGEEKIPAEKADELHRQLRRDLGFVDGGEAGLTKRLVRDMEDIVAKGEGKEEGVKDSEGALS